MEKDNGNEDFVSQSGSAKAEDIQRSTVSRQAQEAVAAIVERVNDGFVGGKVNRTQLANWIILKFQERLSDTEIKEIRSEHFDEITLIESILKQAKESGKVPTELKAILQKHVGNDESSGKRRSKKALTENIINDDIA